MSVQQYCLRWNNHQPNFISVFSSLLHSEALVDVTLAAEGRQLQAHKVVLSACSSYFQALFTANPCQHPIVILKDVQFNDLKTIVDFMYYGEVNVSTEQLPQILKTAETLKIKGLAELPEASGLTKHENVSIGNGAESIWGSTESQTAPVPPINEQQFQQSWQQQQQQQSPPTSGSPAMRRKRLKKSDSGSTERHYTENLQSESNSSRSVKEESVTESTDQPKQDSSQEFQDTETLKIEADVRAVLVPSSSVETVSVPMSSVSHAEGSSSPAVLTHSQSVSGTSSSTTSSTVGSKRQRLLIRQPRVKKELEGHLVQSGSNTPETPELYTTCLLTIPTSRVMERTASEPAPSGGGGGSTKTTIAPTTNSPNLLSVPTQSHLVKQHSHPLLPSQSNAATYTFHRQLSHPVSSSGGGNVTSHPQKSSIEHHKSFDSGTSSQQQPNPLVVIIPDTSTTTSETFTTTTSTTSGLLTVGPHKMKPDEFTRSISSPLSSTTSRELLSLENTTRSSHCPVTRPGPALGCNYCWNTIDAHGRILRRKTKYHCPECQTNLCIVPCFQEYHERWQNENPPPSTEPALKSSNRHQYAKSGSM